MSKFEGKAAIVNDPNCITHGKECVIECWDKKSRKYKVDFDMGWVGWYHSKQLIIKD